MKIFLNIGNRELSEKLHDLSYEIVDEEDTLDGMADLLDYINIDGLIINRLLDTDGKKLLKVCKKAVEKRIKVVILIDSYEGFDERKLVTNLVMEGVRAFIPLHDLSIVKIEEMLLSYPEDFDFSVFTNYEKAKENMEGRKRRYINKVNKGLKRIVAVFSCMPTGKSYIINNLAYTVASKKIDTVLIDGDLKNRSLYYYYHISDENKREGLKNILDADDMQDPKPYGQDFLGGRLKTFSCRKYDEEYQEIPIEINKDKTLTLIDRLRGDNDVVFVDTNRTIKDDLLKSILMMADTILFIQNLDYRMMEENKVALHRLAKMSISTEKMVLVTNQYFENREFNEEKIEEYFGFEFAGRCTIPLDPAMAVKNVRYGKPAVAMKECSEETKEAFDNLAEFCYGIKKIEKRKGLIGKFISKIKS